MQVDVKINSIRPEGSLRAFASVNLNGCFAIRNVKVLESSKGLFVSMPGYKGGNGEFKDHCFPVTKEFREQLYGAVLDAYQQALVQTHSQAQSEQAAPKQAETQEQVPEAPEQASGMQMAGM
ncbi:MAG: SpoVG family protein [Ethanoligenens sp.]